MKELDHPNVVKLYEVIQETSAGANKLLMIMEYVEGGCVLAGSSATLKVSALLVVPAVCLRLRAL